MPIVMGRASELPKNSSARATMQVSTEGFEWDRRKREGNGTVMSFLADPCPMRVGLHTLCVDVQAVTDFVSRAILFADVSRVFAAFLSRT